MRKLALLLPLLPLGLVGCGKGNFNERSASANAKAGVFRYPIPTVPTSMDPGKVQDGDTIDVIQQVYEGLVGWNEKNEVEPKLAESWEVVDGGKGYIFHLRKGAKFSSGREVTAEDFKKCIERNCDPVLHSETAKTYLADIVGVLDVVERKAKSVRGIEVIDPQTLKITIDKPRPYFLGKMTYPCAFVFDIQKLSDPSKEMSQVAEMVGTGGFKFEKVAVEQEVDMVANADYWGGKPAISRIERPYVGDASTRLNMYKNGDIDLVQLERADIEGLKSDPKFGEQLKYYDRPSMWYIGLNCNILPELKNPKVRLAMAMAIDKDAIVRDTLGGVNKKADGIVPPGVFGYREKVKAVPYDPEGAKKLLAEAGYPEGKGFSKLEMSYRNNRPDIRLVAEAVGAQWNKNLGIKTNFRALEWGAYLEQNNKKQLPLFHMRWGADYLDAENFLSTLLASYGNENKVQYSNPTYDDLCRRADTSQDPEERKKLYAQAEDLVIWDAPYIPIYFQRDAELIKPTIKGMRESLFGHLPHVKVSVGQ
jgi:oligopeptide transport system substrate-binding protein